MRRVPVLAMVAIAFLTGVTSAQEKQSMAHVGVGYCRDLGMTPDPSSPPDGSVGIETGIVYRFQGARRFGVGTEVGYLMLGSSTEVIHDPFYNNERYKLKYSWSVIPITWQIYFFFRSKGSAPALTAGIGLYRIKEKETVTYRLLGQDVADEAAMTSIPIGFNLGVDLPIGVAQRGSPRFGIAGRFHVIGTTSMCPFGFGQPLLTVMARLNL